MLEKFSLHDIVYMQLLSQIIVTQFHGARFIATKLYNSYLFLRPSDLACTITCDVNHDSHTYKVG